MKKIFITISLLLPLALSAAPVLAVTSYSRDPGGSPIYEGDTTFSFLYDNWFSDVAGNSAGSAHTWSWWQLQITDGVHYFATDPLPCTPSTGPYQCDAPSSTAPKSVSATFNLPAGNYSYRFCLGHSNSVDANGFFSGPYNPPYNPDVANAECGNYYAIYGNPNAQESFSVQVVPPPPPPPTPPASALPQSINPGDLSVPSSTTHDLLASISNVMGNLGFLGLIVLCAAVPLAFWFMREAISLPPKETKKK